MPISLVLGDDHPIFLYGLEKLLRLQKDFKIVGRCTTGDDALLAVRKHRPDILLLDIRMAGKNAFEVIQEMQDEKLPTRVVLLTAIIHADEALAAARLGVAGVVLKGMAPKLLVQCLRKVHAGEKWLEKNSFSQALDKALRREAAEHQLSRRLSRREIEIMRMVAGGLRNQDVGKKLFISEGTVKIHLHHIYAKLDLHNRVALSVYARDTGLV